MSNVTWSAMRAFLGVVDHRSVRAAARALHVTEPAVSSAVAQIEKKTGAKLLARAGRGVVLTDAGRVYAEYCRTILGLLDESEAAVRRAGAGKLRIGAVATASEYIAPRQLARFRARSPEVELTLAVRPRDDLFVELAHHELDLVIAGRPPRSSGLVTRAERRNQLLLVTAPELEQDPESAAWLLRAPGSGTREATLALLAHLELSPPTFTLGSLGAVVAAAREGLGMTLVHADAVSRDLADGALTQVRVRGTPLSRPWHISTTQAPTRAALDFLDHVCDPAEYGEDRFHLRNRPMG
jgi:LysR family transcriptional regulator, low CO2-responsive transcriptional regulator